MEEAYKQASASTRIDSHTIASSRELLDLLGIPPWVQAPSEGEAQAAYMARQGKVTYAVSQDYDSLLFGSPPVLVRNLTVSGRRKMRGADDRREPPRADRPLLPPRPPRRHERATGRDRYPGGHRLQPRNPGGRRRKDRLKIVQKGGFEEAIAEKQPEFDPAPVRDFFLDPPVTDDYTLEWRPPDVDGGVIEMLSGRYDFSEERVSAALAKVSVKATQKTLDAWF